MEVLKVFLWLVGVAFLLWVPTLFEKIRKKYLRVLLRIGQWVLIVFGWTVWILLILSLFYFPYSLVIFPFLFLFFVLFFMIQEMRFKRYAHQSIIIFGGRGKGKGLLFQKAINKEESALCNIPYGPKSTVCDPGTYFESISPNDFQNAISGDIVPVKPNPEWEGVPYYLDDTAVYFPNQEDSFLKKHFKSLALFITIQRHLYDTYTVLNAQNISRVYKNLRELQVDGYIKARRTIGKGYVWRHLPILRRFFVVKWRFYENIDSAEMGLLPFEKMGFLNKATDRIAMSTASALKEQYDGEHGEIKDGFVFISRKKIWYDSRYYRTLFFKDENDLDETFTFDSADKGCQRTVE